MKHTPYHQVRSFQDIARELGITTPQAVNAYKKAMLKLRSRPGRLKRFQELVAARERERCEQAPAPRVPIVTFEEMAEIKRW